MNVEEVVWATIISGLHVGRTVSEIVYVASHSTAKCFKQRYAKFISGNGLPENFSSERKDHRRRSNTLDNNTLAALQQLVSQDPERSMRLLARELGIS
jgi:hypothetical protein